MKLSALLKDVVYVTASGSLDIEVTGTPRRDSREVKQGELFFAVRGKSYDGHEFIEDAVKNGASVVVCEKIPAGASESATFVEVENARTAMGLMASTFFDHPSSKLKLVGVTGTNGKTTTATLLYQIFRKLGYKVGLVGSIVRLIDETEIPADTNINTPGPVSMNKLLAEMVNAGCSHCFMEVSSHGLDQERVTCLDFAGGIFTNITQDHLDYHKTFENYMNVKQSFFTMLSPGAFALVNRDDKNGEFMMEHTKAKRYFYGLVEEDTLSASEDGFEGKILANSFSGLRLKVNGGPEKSLRSLGVKEIEAKLVGKFNAYNILGAYGAACLLGEDAEKVRQALSEAMPVRGRFEYVEIGGKIGIVDYAHTPDGLEKVLETIQEIKSKNQRIITVSGCGGNRDREKRPMMARIAHRLSDHVIFTADNPRDEDPEAILNEMEAGLENPTNDSKVHRISDRREAIKKAVELANVGDIILIAGKGHETYQEIKGKRIDFDDKKILEEFLKI